MTAHVSLAGDAGEEFGKDSQLTVHERQPFNAGTPPDRLRASFITPTNLFYVRNHAAVPRLEEANFRVKIEGEVERPREISLAELKENFTSHTVTATLQCAGNRRDGLMAVAPIRGEVEWSAGAIGTARWTGVRLADVLRAAGLGSDARHVCLLGADEVEKAGARFFFGVSIEIEKAMHDEVLLVFEMNDEPLAPVHGAPLRVVVPGYIGARSVKWLTSITLARTPSENYYQQKAYKLFPAHTTAESAQAEDKAHGIMLGALSINSSICRPADGTDVDAGRVRVEGYAMAGGERTIARVEVSPDAGETWQVARLDESQMSDDDARWTWRLWTAELNLAPGAHRLAVRAWDSAANTQPSSAAQLWNFKGYMNNAWHIITIKAREF